MFEFDKAETHPQPAAAPAASYTPFEGGRRRALLLWSEHCTECAAPDCYTSCSLYAPRADGRCRRFDFGVRRNRNFPCASGTAAEIVFRRWGKIEAKGNTRLLPAWAAGAAERLLTRVSPLLDRFGKVAARASGDRRWSWLAFSLLDRLASRLGAGAAERPDGFVAEIYNPGDAPVTLLLTMAVDRTRLGRSLRADQLPKPVLRTLTVPPGYFRENIPASAFIDLTGSGLPFGISLTPGAEEGAHLVFLTLDFVQYRTAARPSAVAAQAQARPAAKCVVFDLDNTLWDGILLEGNVALRDGVRDLFRTLDERGVLLSAVSKNAPEDAMAELRRLGLDDYLLHPQIGWGPKSESLRRLAQRLDLGLDSFLFIDDNPFERAEVAEALPQVEALPDTALPTLLAHPRLQGAVTDESRRRRLMYREAAAREEAAAESGGDYRAFLRSCEVRVEIRPPAPADRRRIAELVQRTNQLNFSGRKYSDAEVAAILADPEREKYVVACRDRFGDYGIVGFCLARVEEETVRVEDLMLSCRVQGKYIEQALFAHLAHRPGWSARRIEVNYRGTARNAAARAVLDGLGFHGDAPLTLDLAGRDLSCDIVAVEGEWPAQLSPAA